MPIEGEWTVDGSAADLRLLSARLRATGQSGLKKNIAKAMRVATLPARDAVKAELRDVMPRGGGLNEWAAASSITSVVLTGPKTAGVVVRGRKNASGGHAHDLKALNKGAARHPVYGNRHVWRETKVASGWWEHALDPFGVVVREALKVAQNVTAKEAGF